MGIKCPPFYGENEAFYINDGIAAFKRVKSALKNNDKESAIDELNYVQKCKQILLENLLKEGK